MGNGQEKIAKMRAWCADTAITNEVVANGQSNIAKKRAWGPDTGTTNEVAPQKNLSVSLPYLSFFLFCKGC